MKRRIAPGQPSGTARQAGSNLRPLGCKAIRRHLAEPPPATTVTRATSPSLRNHPGQLHFVSHGVSHAQTIMHGCGHDRRGLALASVRQRVTPRPPRATTFTAGPRTPPEWMRAGPSPPAGGPPPSPIAGLDHCPGGEYGVSGDWAGRAGTVEEAIRRRFVRRLAGVVPGTRIGRVRWPRPLPIRPWPWNYWWQAHLLDCLVDAHRRAPQPWRTVEIAALARTVRLRNLGSWTNRLLRRHRLVRPGGTARRATGPPVNAIRAGRDHRPATRRMDDGRRRRDLVAPRGRLQERPRQRSGRDSGRPHRRPRLRHQDHRLDRGHPGRSADRPGPRRGPAQPGRNDPHRRSHHLHLLPRRVPGGVRGAGRARR